MLISQVRCLVVNVVLIDLRGYAKMFFVLSLSALMSLSNVVLRYDGCVAVASWISSLAQPVCLTV